MKNDLFYVEKTKVYRKTYWLITILGDIISGLFEIAAIICLFLDKSKVILKYTYFIYFLIAGISVLIICNIVNSVMLRFVYKEDINYNVKKTKSKIEKECKNYDEINSTDEIIEDNIVNYYKKDAFYKRPGFYLLVAVGFCTLAIVIFAIITGGSRIL